jgi:hypothetical protein
MEQVLELIKPLIEVYLGHLGFLVQLVAIVGSLRLAIKPLMSLIDVYVKSTPSPKDDGLVLEIEQSKFYKGLIFVLDYIFSIKIKK